MTDVVGAAEVVIRPDGSAFAVKLEADLAAAARNAAAQLRGVLGSAVSGLQVSFAELAASASASLGKVGEAAVGVEQVLNRIDTIELANVTAAAQTAATSVSEIAGAAGFAETALNQLDGIQLARVAAAAQAAATSVSEITGAAGIAETALNRIDSIQLANLARAAAAAGGAVAGIGAKAEAAEVALNNLDTIQLRNLAAAAAAAAAAVDLITAAAVGAERALNAIDTAQLLAVVAAAEAAAAAVAGIGAAAAATDLSLGRIDSREMTLLAGSANAASASLGGVAAASQGAATGFTTGKIAAAGFAAGLGVLGGVGLKLAADFQQTEIAFEGILGSAEAADAFIADLRDFAASTPFDFTQLTGAAQKLLALGQTGDEVLSTLTLVGDAVAAVGGGTEQVNGVVLALSQMEAKGRLSAQELNQIAERLPNFDRSAFFDQLADSIGVTGDEIRKMADEGEIAATEAMPVLLASLEKLPGALGAMERQSKTLTGQLSNLKDVVEFELTDAFTPLAESIQTLIGPFAEAIQGTLSTLAPSISRGLEALAGLFVDVFDRLGPAFGLAVGGIVDVIAPILDTVVTLFTAVGKPILEFVGFLGPLIGEALQPLAEAFGTVSGLITGNLRSALEAIGPPLLMIAQIFGEAAADILPTLALKLSGVVEMIGEKLGPVLLRIVPSIGRIVDALGGAFVTVVDKVIDILPDLIDAVLLIAEVFADRLAGVAEDVLPALADAFVQILDVLPELLPLLTDALVRGITELAYAFVELVERGTIQKLVDLVIALLPLLPGLIELIPTIATAMVGLAVALDAVLTVLVPVADAVAQVLGFGLQELVLLIGELLNGDWSAVTERVDAFYASFLDGIERIKSAIGDFLGGQWDLFIADLEAGWGRITAFFTEKWDLFWTDITTGIETIKLAFLGFFTGVETLFSNLIDTVSKLPGKLAEAAVGLWDWLGEGLGSAWNGIADFLESVQVNIDIPDWVASAAGIPDPITLGIGPLPRFDGLEMGGIVNQDGLYRLGEGNKPEAVVPLTNPSRADKVLSAAGLGGDLIVNIPITVGPGMTPADGAAIGDAAAAAFAGSIAVRRAVGF